MRYERDVGEPPPRTEDERSPEAGQTLMSSPVIPQRYQDPQAGASWRKGLTAQRFLDIGLSERSQMRLWEMGGSYGCTRQVQWNRNAR